MDGRSWSPKEAVRRDDQFTQAPDFYDEHDSDHLPMWGRLAASWHGLAPSRKVVFAASVLAVAVAMAALAISLSAAPGSSPGPSSPVGDTGATGAPPLPSPSQPLNVTAPQPSASPGVPPLPAPTIPPALTT